MFDDGPPFDSARMNNHDNDDEVLIEVFTEDEHDKEKADMKIQIDRKIKMHNKAQDAKKAKKSARYYICIQTHVFKYLYTYICICTDEYI